MICITKLDQAANSLTRSIAGWLRFFTLIQCFAGPPDWGGLAKCCARALTFTTRRKLSVELIPGVSLRKSRGARATTILEQSTDEAFAQ